MANSARMSKGQIPGLGKFNIPREKSKTSLKGHTKVQKCEKSDLC